MKNVSYELWFYDVWGNKEEGFTVNDRRCATRDFVIPTMPKTYNKGKPGQFTDFVPSDKEILEALVDAGELEPSALYANIDIDGDGETIYLTEENGYPLCELLLNPVEIITPTDLVCTPVDFLNPGDRVRIENYQANKQ